MTKKTALIAGATGAIGSALAKELVKSADWTVYGISRSRPIDPVAGMTYRNFDLNDLGACKAGLVGCTDITHVFYCGRATHGEQVLEDVAGNLKLLENLVAAVESLSSDVQHIHLLQGGKYYGVHLGPMPTPACEDAFRTPVINFNHAQQDFLESSAAAANWTWSCSRPNTLLHFSPAIARNLVSSLVTYGLICRERGVAMDFPGPVGAYDSLTQLSTLSLVAKGMVWASSEPDCQNQGYNFTNTDLIRWKNLWPRLADTLGVRMGSVKPMKLANVMPQHNDAWQSICEKHQLRLNSLDQVANWGYLDATLERTWDEILCHNKVRSLGFHGWDNSEERFFNILAQYRHANIFPS